MVTSAPVQVEGLVEFQRTLRAADKDLPKQLRLANKAAAEIVAAGTRASFASRGGVAPKVVPSVKAVAEQRSGSVKIGGKRHPYAMGAEFGGGLHGPGNPTARGGHTTQFPPWRGNGPDAGYSLYPTVRDKTDEVVDTYGDAIDRLLSAAFPD